MSVASSALSPIALGSLPERPLVSVLIANYNYERYVGQAIASVLNQTYPNVEVLVCDDASIDRSRAVIAAACRRDERVQLIPRAENGGMAAAWNTAYARCRGDIICLLDADDLFVPDKIERVVSSFRQHRQTGLLIHPLLVMDESETEIQRIPFATDFETGWIAERLVRRGGRWRDMPTSAISFRRSVAEYVFPIPEGVFRRGADGFIFTLLPLITAVGAIDDPLARYRVHGSNMLGARTLTERSIATDLEFVTNQTRETNIRLRQLGRQVEALDVECNLFFRQRRYFAVLLGSTEPGERWAEFRKLVPVLLGDDLFRRRRKNVGLIIDALALVLPRPLRSRLVDLAFGYSGLRRRLQRVASMMSSARRGTSYGTRTA